MSPLTRALVFVTCLNLAVCATTHHGKLIASLSEDDHEVRGKVYAVDSKRIRVMGFHYDGTAPDAFFWAGVKGKSSDSVDGTGVIIPDEIGGTNKLRSYNNEDLVLTLPDGVTVTDLKWISIWCRQVGVSFGSVNVPADFVPPAKRNIGKFSELAHQVRSGDVTIQDARTFLIRDLHYDGGGPDAFFWVGKGTDIKKGEKIPDENGSSGILKKYSGQDITLRLPAEYTVFDIDFLSMYCITFTEDFGHVVIPDDLNVPPYLGSNVMSLQNCEEVHESMHVSWQVNGDEIMIELSGQIEPGRYMSFGLSGSDSRTSMDDADVTVAWLTEGRESRAVDYFLNARAQCSNGVGACPDTAQGGQEHVTVISGKQVDGVTYIRYKRKLNTGDDKDGVYKIDAEQYLAWAMGPINPEGFPHKHDTVVRGNLKWNFGRTAAKNCPDFKPKKPADLTPWAEESLKGSDLANEFLVEIGQSGGQRGYKAITGKVSWGIAYYINEKLIPVLHLKRGETYTFTIKTGNNQSNLAEYHPFYITDDPAGGHVQCKLTDTCDAKIYAGLDQNGKPIDGTVGPLCEWEHKDGDQSSTKNTFEEFFKTLKRNCKPGTPGVLKWTPDRNTPDTVYYQCYQHRYLGWKIRLDDDGTSMATIQQLHTAMLVLVASVLHWLIA